MDAIEIEKNVEGYTLKIRLIVEDNNSQKIICTFSHPDFVVIHVRWPHKEPEIISSSDGNAIIVLNGCPHKISLPLAFRSKDKNIVELNLYLDES